MSQASRVHRTDEGEEGQIRHLQEDTLCGLLTPPLLYYTYRARTDGID